MCFNILYTAWQKPGVLIGGRPPFFLAGPAGPSKGAPAAAGIVDRASADDSTYCISIGHSAIQRLEADYRTPCAPYISISRGIAEFTSTVWRHHSTLRIGNIDLWLQNNIGAASQRCLA